MPINISIKNVPDRWVQQLRERASKHHRSLQGELMAMLEKSIQPENSLSPEELLDEIQQLNLHTPSESMDMIREDRLDR